MIWKRLEMVAEADLQRLISDQESERKTLDYKRDLPGNSDSEKIEFLADVSSLANTAGGDLIFGIDAPAGVPTAMRGLVIGSLEAEKLRLENMVRDGMDPRLPRMDLRDIPLSSGQSVLVVRLAKSWIAPHRVIFKGHGHFYARNSTGKYRLDVDQLREAFTLSGTLVNRLRAFRMNRVIAVKADEVPERLNEGPKMIVHVVPLSSSSEGRVDLGEGLGSYIRSRLIAFRPMGYSSAWDQRVNLDGRVVYPVTSSGGTAGRSYTQFYRFGAVEGVACLPTVEREGREFILCRRSVQDLRRFLVSHVSAILDLGVELPFYFFLSFVGLKGHFLSDEFFRSESDGPVERDDLSLPEQVIEGVPIDLDALLFPLLTSLWNSAGSEYCHHFDQNRRWQGP